MSTYTTNTKPASKFEDVPEEVLTDPTMRTALGMDPIPGMNTPVDDNKQISLFDYMQNKNNSSSSSSTTTTAAPEVTVFKNLVHPEFGELRTVEIDGEPWFVGKDVAAALGYADVNKAVAMHVENEDKKLNDKSSPSFGQRGATLINESGLYSLILSSKLESAKRFKHWVTSEVLPCIRKTGGSQRIIFTLYFFIICSILMISSIEGGNTNEKEVQKFSYHFSGCYYDLFSSALSIGSHQEGRNKNIQ